jgi:outer membrane protein TolC
MISAPADWRKLRVLAMIWGCGLALAGAASAQAPLPAQQPPAEQAVRAGALNLADCLKVALQRQPRLAANRASLAAAEEGCRALENLHIPPLVMQEVAIRRKQASLGVAAAVATVDQAEREAVYAVTRTYLTVLFAREQERVAGKIADRLSVTRDSAQRAVDAGARDVTAADVSRALVYLRLAESKQIQANQGVKRALIALREAIGLGPDAVIDVPPGRLPDVEVRPDRDKVVALALSHRGELIRAGIFAEVAQLEVKAQAASLYKRTETFASGADIHAVLVPPGSQDTDYRPAAIPPEMPPLLVGSCTDRAKRAQWYSVRAQAVTETTANLIALEAEDAFLRWEEAARQIATMREAADTGDALADGLNKDFAAGLKIKVEDIISARLLAAQARAQYNEFLYRQALALADLERITGGAFCGRLVEATAAPPIQWKSSGPK